MMKKYKRKLIRTVTRKNIPETNSSSSHSVIIDYNSMNNSSEGLVPDENGIITIPSPSHEFGWEFRRFNDPLQKIQYYLGLMLWGEYYVNNEHSRDKEIYRLKEIIKKFTGAKDVKFEWEEKFGKSKKMYVYAPIPEVDHQSKDLIKEVGESEETIKNFIFSRNSWVITGNDNSFISRHGMLSGIIEDIAPDDHRSIGKITRVHFPEPIGDIDLRSEDIYSDITTDLEGDCREILNSVRLKIKDNGEVYSYFKDTQCWKIWEDDKDSEELAILDYINFPKIGDIIYAKPKVGEELFNIYNTPPVDILSENKESEREKLIAYLTKILKEGVDWVAVGTTEYFDEFGTI